MFVFFLSLFLTAWYWCYSRPKYIALLWLKWIVVQDRKSVYLSIKISWPAGNWIIIPWPCNV